MIEEKITPIFSEDDLKQLNRYKKKDYKDKLFSIVTYSFQSGVIGIIGGSVLFREIMTENPKEALYYYTLAGITILGYTGFKKIESLVNEQFPEQKE